MALCRHWIIGPWRVDGDADEIEAGGRVLKLEPLQMRLLLMLAERAPQVVPTQDLLDEVWRDLVVTPNSVYQAVAQLRRQLGDTAAEPSFIQTVHRKGYRLLAPARRSEAAPAALPPSAPAPPEAAAALAPAPLRPPARQRRALVLAGAAAAAGLAGFAVLAWQRSRPGAAPAGRPRLAVLPFGSRSLPGHDGTEQALGQGLALDVIRALGRRADLDVLAPDTVLGLQAETGAQRSALAQRLGVTLLLTGELVRDGTRLQVQAGLLSITPAGTPGSGAPVTLWQRRYERSLAVVSQLPGEIAAEVAMALALPPTGQPAVQPGPTEAYELYVLGENAWHGKTTEAFERARAYFQRGITLDPGFARNYVGLGWAWLGQATSGAGLDLPDAIARAAPLFERALALEPEAADALTGRARIHLFAGEPELARALLARALAAQPNYNQAHFTLGSVEFSAGWPQKAVPHFERAAALSPLSASPVERLALARLFAGQADLAAQGYRRAITLEPRFPNGVWGLGIHGYAVGNLVQAVDGYRQALALEPRRPYLWHELAWIYLDLQRPDDAAAAFTRALEQLPGAHWLAVNAAFAWVTGSAAAGGRGAPPAALALDPALAGDGSSFVDLCHARAMAGLPLDAALLQHSLAVAAARGQGQVPDAWFPFQGWLRPLNLATVQTVLGQAEAAAATLAAVAQQLDALEHQGNRWPMLHFHRARVAALRQRPAEALAALERAVEQGCRRSWWLRLDPALAPLRTETRLQRLLAQVDERLAQQRRQLGL